MRINMTIAHIPDLLETMDICYNRFNQENLFTGPSLYFHKEAIKYHNKDYEKTIEEIYALLPSWGMHRMGPNGPKVEEHDYAIENMKSIKEDVISIRQTRVNTFENENIYNAFIKLDVMRNDRVLIGNSKILHHLVPEKLGIVDNQYTLGFIERSSIPVDKDDQFTLYKWVHENVYYPIQNNPIFNEYYSNIKKGIWNTSKLKAIDNLIIGYVKEYMQ